MESLEDTSSHSTRGSGVKKITGVIMVIVVALGFIFFGTRADPGTSTAAGGLNLAVFDQTARWMDPASVRRRRNASPCRHHMEQCRLQQRRDM